MSYLGEVDQAVGAMRREGCHRIVLLHGAASYPAQAPDINLRAMSVITASLRLPVGVLDNTPETEIALGAVALGACVVQKSLSLDTNGNGPEHASSLNPEQFTDMVDRIRNLERAMGDGIKKPAFSEMDNRDQARRSLALARNIKKGEKISAKDLIALRPAKGISPIHEGQIAGKTTRRDLSEGTFIGWGDIE
jgi:sialic acid synthase SpsE